MKPLSFDSLPPMDIAARAARVRPSFADAGIDALLVTHLPNVRYLTGFTGSSAMLLVTDDEIVFTSDGRYRTQAGEQLSAAGVDARIEIGATVA
jgi:Xaa-Pro aminopeptidase